MDLLKRRRMMWGGEKDESMMPLTFKIIADGGDIVWKAAGTAVTIEYSKNGGEWTPIKSTSDGAVIPTVAGDILRFRGDTWPGSGNYTYNTFRSNQNFLAYGNPASLKYGDELTGQEALAPFCFTRLFYGAYLLRAPALPATRLEASCYRSMFYGCRIIEPPLFGAKTLADSCCLGMFQSCHNLTKSPELQAETLEASCYAGMFRDCNSLNQVKCAAADISASGALTGWLYGVAASGTFTKKAGVTYPEGEAGIPSGWTVIEV